MLSSRNRRLKRLSRLVAFFVIVFAGCYYRFQKIFENFQEYTSSDDFMEQSPFVPPFIKEISSEIVGSWLLEVLALMVVKAIFESSLSCLNLYNLALRSSSWGFKGDLIIAW